jgi:hypothetical protein
MKISRPMLAPLFLFLIAAGENRLFAAQDVPVQTPEMPGGPKIQQPLISSSSPEGTENPITPTNRIELFNGKNFEGFAFVSRNTAVPPSATWSVTNSLIHCAGQPIGYLRTKKSFRDYELTVEWRFVKVIPKTADNTGVLVHMQLPDKVWPMCAQVQGKHDRQGDLFLMAGAESKEHRGEDANTPIPMRGESAEKPVGEWNISETICAGDSVKAFINGRLMNEATDCTVSNGFVGIQSEGAEIEIRKMFLEPVK